MPTLADIEQQVAANTPSRAQVLDAIRHKALENLSGHTGRNAIAYYSGWLDRHVMGTDINDTDINGLMNVVHGMERGKGLDLILHTPGGGIAATECIVRYLRSLFCGDIRCIVPQLAMSAGTMIACSAKEIVMGRQSSIGPIDPQLRGVPCHGVVEEFRTAARQLKKDGAKIGVWSPIIEQYTPTFLGECQKAIELSKELVTEWLETGMFAGDPKAKSTARRVVKVLGDHGGTKTHDRHISADGARKIGLKVIDLEKDNKLQDLVLTAHHSFMLTFINAPLIKIIESSSGRGYYQRAPAQQA